MPRPEQKRDLSDEELEEIELRKQVRSGLRVERAVNQPGGRPAPVITPGEGEKE